MGTCTGVTAALVCPVETYRYRVTDKGDGEVSVVGVTIVKRECV